VNVARAIVFIHGAWLSPVSWTAFMTEFTAKGYECQAPAWPYLDCPVSELRANPAPELAHLGITEIVDHYAKLISAFAQPPILIGHSFGGLIVQLLLDRGLGAAGVAIDPAPARGILAGPVTIKTGWPVLSTWKGWAKVHTMPETAFASGFGNALAAGEQHEAYRDFIVPAPGRIFFQAAFGIANKIHWNNPKRAPLLLTAGGLDRTVEPGMVRKNYKKASAAPSTTTLLELPGKCHFLMVQDGWRDVAAQILAWLDANAPARLPSS
jgi:alpha-beta hydrolase superfamily lysophospholipase